MNPSQCTDLFADVFDSHCGGIIRTCCCGRTFYNYMDAGCFEPGELAELEEKTKTNPDKYCAVDHTVGTMSFAGNEIVYGCHCDTAKNYERFILAHAERLAEYIRRHSKELQEKSKRVDVPL